MIQNKELKIRHLCYSFAFTWSKFDRISFEFFCNCVWSLSNQFWFLGSRWRSLRHRWCRSCSISTTTNTHTQNRVFIDVPDVTLRSLSVRWWPVSCVLICFFIVIYFSRENSSSNQVAQKVIDYHAVGSYLQNPQKESEHERMTSNSSRSILWVDTFPADKIPERYMIWTSFWSTSRSSTHDQESSNLSVTYANDWIWQYFRVSSHSTIHSLKETNSAHSSHVLKATLRAQLSSTYAPIVGNHSFRYDASQHSSAPAVLSTGSCIITGAVRAWSDEDTG